MCASSRTKFLFWPKQWQTICLCSTPTLKPSAHADGLTAPGWSVLLHVPWCNPWILVAWRSMWLNHGFDPVFTLRVKFLLELSGLLELMLWGNIWHLSIICLSPIFSSIILCKAPPGLDHICDHLMDDTGSMVHAHSSCCVSATPSSMAMAALDPGDLLPMGSLQDWNSASTGHCRFLDSSLHC